MLTESNDFLIKGKKSYIIKPMESEAEIDGKGYVHYKSWQETCRGLIDDGYLQTVTEEKCKKIAHRWTDNILVAKDGERVVGFVGYGAYRDKNITGKTIGYELMNAAFEKLSAYPKIAVWVLKGNEWAIRFYERYGFRFDGEKEEIMLGTTRTEYRMIFKKES